MVEMGFLVLGLCLTSFFGPSFGQGLFQRCNEKFLSTIKTKKNLLSFSFGISAMFSKSFLNNKTVLSF